ncbi:hypothetical protein GGQ88_003933 [Novosphingobium hassiacum]|uniref:Uncharacterized protein n=1 Tax=Novosphingobium hassiacum TaxID=173676 RepID=A0A7W6A013_9SPHN|nr:hypothetical protein [Novosphingobium hassiacum]
MNGWQVLAHPINVPNVALCGENCPNRTLGEPGRSHMDWMLNANQALAA